MNKLLLRPSEIPSWLPQKRKTFSIIFHQYLIICPKYFMCEQMWNILFKISSLRKDTRKQKKNKQTKTNENKCLRSINKALTRLTRYNGKWNTEKAANKSVNVDLASSLSCLGFPGSSAGNEYICNAGDLSSILVV